MSARQPVTRTNADWTRITTASLRRHARREFATQGYDGASIDRVAARAGVTKGAIYYHYGSKAGLFEAVFRDVESEIVIRIDRRAAAAREPVEAVLAGCVTFLDLALDDAMRQIGLVDAPRVLGWARWRAIDSEFGLGSLKRGLAACAAASHATAGNLDVLAHLISGALNEAVFVIAEAADRRRAHRQVVDVLVLVLRGMLVAGPARVSR